VINSNVLFLCTRNSRRTQMAEGFLRALAGDDFEVVSAGAEETTLDPDAVAAIREVRIDISGQEMKAVNRYLGRRSTMS
jgi:arsenate reductase